MARARTLTLNTKVNVTGQDKLKGLGDRLQSVGKTLTVGVTLPLLALGGGMAKLAIEAEQSRARLDSAFKSMGASAWTTTDALEATAQALQDMTTFGDEEIRDLQAVMLTFGNVTGDAFDKAIVAALDMSSALGTDLQSSAIQLGKALNDPIQGVSALSRVGVSFTESQKDMIRTLQESGDLLGAQTIILGEMERQFGGTAEAMAQTAGGQMKQAMNALADAGEAFGEVIIPVLADVAKGVKDFANFLKGLDVGTRTFIVQAGLLVAALGPVLFIVGSLIKTFGVLIGIFKGVSVAGGALVALGPRIGASFTAMLGPIGLAAAALAGIVLAGNEIAKALNPAKEAFVDLASQAGRSHQEIATDLRTLARVTGKSLDEAAQSVVDYAEQTGSSYDAAVRAVRRGGAAMTAEQREMVLESGAAWERYQKQIRGTVDESVGIIIDGVSDMADEMGEAPGKMADELLAAQFRLTDATSQLVDFMERALSPAQEKFQIQGFLASKELAKGLASNNPLIRQKADEMRQAAEGRLRELNGYNYGYRMGTTLAAGLSAAVGVVRTAAAQLGSATAGQIAIRSEPKDPSSPLRGITKWGGNIAKTLAEGISRETGLVNAALRGLVMPGLGTLATVPIVSSGGSGGQTIINNYYQLNYSGQHRSFEREDEFLRALKEMAEVTG